MPGLTRSYEYGGRIYSLLRVPYHPQGEDPLGSGASDNFCLPMSLKMVLDFLVDPYQAPKIRQNNRAFTVNEITQFLTFHPYTACKVYSGFLNPLNDDLNFVRFQEMHMDSLELVDRELKQEKPVVLLYNPQTYVTGIPVQGIGHAIVATGFSEDYLFVNDPFERSPRVLHRKKFEDAWVHEPWNAITLRPKLRQERLDTEQGISRKIDKEPVPQRGGEEE